MNRTEVISEVVNKYIGLVYSVGSEATDTCRLENLKVLIELIDILIDKVIDEYIATKRSFESSRQKSNKVCKDYISNIEAIIKDALE